MNDNEKRILINQIKWKKEELKSAEDALRFWTNYKYLENADGYAKHYEKQVEEIKIQLVMLKHKCEEGDL